MAKDKSQIKNAATERMFLKVAPDHLVDTYFGFFESTDAAIQERSNALATMFAAKYSEAAFNELLAFYKFHTGRHFQLYSEEPDKTETLPGLKNTDLPLMNKRPENV